MRFAEEKAFATHDGVELFYRHWPAAKGRADRAIVLTGLALYCLYFLPAGRAPAAAAISLAAVGGAVQVYLVFLVQLALLVAAVWMPG